MPESGMHRSFARITAMEYLFVVWACYLFWLYVAYFGASETLMMVAYGSWALWFLYIFRRLFLFPRAGSTFRYAIAVGIVGWGLGEMPSYMGAYDEFWLKPFDYPVSTLLALAAQIGGIAYIARVAGQRKPPADSRAAAATA
jgi:hypothetical protein